MDNVQGPPCPRGFSKALWAKTLGPTLTLPSPLTLSHPSARPQPSAGAFSRVLASEHWGFGTPKPQCQTHPTASPPPGHIRAPPIIQGGRTGRAHRARGDIQRSRAINPLGPSSPTQRPQLGPPLLSPHSHKLQPACLLEANPNPRSATQGPFPRSLEPQRW